MTSEKAYEDVGGASRGERKRASILAAAQELFFANGFVGTSMDQVAAAAAVSKQTVYKHFRDKESLFREVVMNVLRARDGGIPADLLVAGQGSIEERLRSFAREFLTGVMQPEVLSLRRLVIGEVTRFPELGRTFYDAGPRVATEQLAVALREAAKSCGVPMKRPMIAAEHLVCLLLSPLNQATLLGEQFRMTEAELYTSADEAVAAFLRAYGFTSDATVRPQRRRSAG